MRPLVHYLSAGLIVFSCLTAQASEVNDLHSTTSYLTNDSDNSTDQNTSLLASAKGFIGKSTELLAKTVAGLNRLDMPEEYIALYTQDRAAAKELEQLQGLLTQPAGLSFDAQQVQLRIAQLTDQRAQWSTVLDRDYYFDKGDRNKNHRGIYGAPKPKKSAYDPYNTQRYTREEYMHLSPAQKAAYDKVRPSIRTVLESRYRWSVSFAPLFGINQAVADQPVPQFVSPSASDTDNTPAMDAALRYSDGARWAFITDATTAQIAVIDTFSHRHVDTLTMPAIPVAMAASDLQDMLIYIDGKKPLVYAYDLAHKRHWTMPVESVPEAILVHPEGEKVAVALKDRIVLVEPFTNTLTDTITDLAMPFSMNFDTSGYNLYITEQNTGRTTIWRLHDSARRELRLGGGGQVTEVTLSPDTRLVMVGDEQNNQVAIWDLFMENPLPNIAMASTPSRPYVSSDSEHIILASDNGQGLIVDAWTGDIKRTLSLDGATFAIRTGWLETLGAIATNKALHIFSLNDDRPVKKIPLTTPLNDVVVVSDSKTLFATQEKNSALLVVDLRKEEQLPPIETGLASPQQVVMALTNTICH